MLCILLGFHIIEPPRFDRARTEKPLKPSKHATGLGFGLKELVVQFQSLGFGPLFLLDSWHCGLFSQKAYKWDLQKTRDGDQPKSSRYQNQTGSKN